MKTKMFKSVFFLFLALFTFGCLDEDVELNEIKQPQYKIIKATLLEKTIVSDWISSSISSRINGSFSVEDLQKIVDLENGYQILTILDSSKSNEAMSFSLNEAGQVVFSFLSKTFKSENGDITNEIYSTNGNLRISYVDKPDGTRRIIYSENSIINGRTTGWWSDADDCVGRFHNLTPSNIANSAIAIIFNSATAGLYSPLSLVVCAGYATALLAK
jgi:hypothetical protein